MRVMLGLFWVTIAFAQCDDVEVSTKWAKHYSEVVFQGTVVGFRGPENNRNVVFQVSRVWKGHVGRTFEMPAVQTNGGLCSAFWMGLLAVGNELVVYASRPIDPNEYLPIRSKTTLVSKAKDLKALGRGHAPE